MEYCLGIDTSNYTTSLAASAMGSGEVVFVRKLLQTAPGSVGLRQSDAHFLHTKNLPELARDLRAKLPADARISRVCVSSRPRPVEGSYMPCFLAGVSAAHLAALSAGCEVFETSHQEGHIAAALYGCPDFPDVDRFYAMHLSGGTMELVSVQKQTDGYAIELLASSLDVTAGQLIDRVGVMLSMAFPCGRELDRLALSYRGEKCPGVHLALREGGINLSGLENRARALFEQGKEPCAIAHFLFSHVARAILALRAACTDTAPLLLCGGVSASAFLRERLRPEGIYFTDPALATDNAVGVSLLGKQRGGQG